MFKIFVSDSYSPAALDFLKKQKDIEVHVETGLSEDELAAKIAGYDALLVRSATKVTQKIIEAGKQLSLIGRAGVGTDNIDKKAASDRGILVINAPLGNLISVAELVYGHLLSALRRLADAHATTKAGKWEKKVFEKAGHELYGKTLGIIGLGNIGQLVAKRAPGFGLNIIAYDPVTTSEVAERVGAKLVDLDTLWQQADFITLHVPLIPQTKHIVNAESLKKMKKTAIVVNCARGGVIDDKALAKALKAGELGAACLDCFEVEPPQDSPLLALDNCFFTPHIGGSTVEAQERVGLELVDQIVRALRGELVEHVVNLPFRVGSSLPDQKSWNELAEKLAKLAARLGSGKAIKKAELLVAGEIASKDTKLLQVSVLKGLLESLSGETNVNFINATDLAEKKGLKLKVETAKSAGKFTNQISLSLTTSKDTIEVRGTVADGQPRVTFVQDFHTDFTPGARMLLTRHRDQPGIIGQVGTLLGQHGVNIASMDLGRNKIGGEALMILELDHALTAQVLKDLEALEKFEEVFWTEL